MRTLLLDGQMYKVSQGDYDSIESAELACYGSCNDSTLENLRNECNRIKEAYDPIMNIELRIDTPPDETDLPF